MVFEMVAYSEPSGSNIGMNRPPAFTKMAGIRSGKNHFWRKASHSAWLGGIMVGNYSDFPDLRRLFQGGSPEVRAGALAILPKDKDTGCAQPDE